MSANEHRIQSWILAKLEERYPDSVWDRQNVVGAKAGKDRFIKAGTPGQGDIRGCHRGRYIELEVKQPGKLQQPNQRERQQNILHAGGIYAVVHNPNEAFAVVDAL